VYEYTGTLRANSVGTSVQTREEDAAGVYRYTGALRANSAGMGGQALPFRLSSSAGSVMARSCAAVCLLLAEGEGGGGGAGELGG